MKRFLPVCYLLPLTQIILADTIVPVTSQTQVYTISDIPIINIAQPSASGLSHNKYDSFNVGQKGVVLNTQTNKWKAQIVIDGIFTYLGSYNN